ncbi:xanthine dehydrogenase subunit XdhB [Candidatus Formimonas warabiya]|uniref:Xanthine dehydrogenase FAD-binding subunit XdhB n=1 Tax=Formimonas warabiya TaxID=1761012 RepID=A0A3G1KQW3_FORW1|nr:xanthine dehydrogenase subunit XdhB [Candidatus Formimonas warabiya]ATW24844.1 xanthine dehydrogenase FAD-binding subunit XdhB [Candidatus Formimonas warabiya]
MYDIAHYEEAHSVQEAVQLLQAHPRARLIAGGSDLLIKIHEGKMPDAELISIHGIPELKGIHRDEQGTISIGSGTTFSEITRHALIGEHVPVLGEAVDKVGGPQIRNIGTIGGNICNGVTSADSASTLFALNARLRIQGAGGMREVAIGDFYLGPGRVDLRHDEVLTAILLTRENYEGFGGHYIKFAMRNAMDIATLGCAVLCRLKDKRTVEDFRLALGVAAPTPMRCLKTEDLVKGKAFSAELLQEAGRTAVTEVNPRTSWRASREYRLQLVEELSKRAFQQAFVNAGGEMV